MHYTYLTPPGLRPGEMELLLKHNYTLRFLFNGKELNVSANGQHPMFNVADINQILGNGNLEGAVNRAKGEYWMEEDEAGSEYKRYPKFEENGTPSQLWTDYLGVILLSHRLIQPYDSEKILWRPVDLEFTDWFEDVVMGDFY